jgi:hypothetical protein
MFSGGYGYRGRRITAADQAAIYFLSAMIKLLIGTFMNNYREA